MVLELLLIHSTQARQSSFILSYTMTNITNKLNDTYMHVHI